MAFSVVGKVCPAVENWVDPGYIEQDKTWLAMNIYFEARNDITIRGRLGVAYAVLNRVYSTSFPNTIKEVITEQSQFSWYWDNKSDEPDLTDSIERAAWFDCVELAELAVSTYTPNESIGGAVNYHPDYINPYWADDMILIGKYGKHKFYR